MILEEQTDAGHERKVRRKNYRREKREHEWRVPSSSILLEENGSNDIWHVVTGQMFDICKKF